MSQVIAGGGASVSYEEFLRSKTRLVQPSGFDVGTEWPHLYPFQRDLVRWALRQGRCALFADTGLGKAQPIDEIVLTPDGWRPIGDISVGDLVVGGNGHPTRVLGVYPQGVRRVFKLLFSDGAECRADGEHLWSVRTDVNASRGDDWRVMTTNEIAADLRAPDGRARWRVPVVSVEWPDIDLPIDPYVVGILIGDGYITGNRTVPIFTTDDTEIVETVNARLPTGFRCALVTNDAHCPSYAISRKAGIGVGSSPSVVISALRDLGLWGCDSFSKFIPDIFLRASLRQRADLLRGLMDSDGWTGTATQFTTSNERLALEVCGLVRSLGGTAHLSSKLPIYTHKGEQKRGAIAYAVTLKVPFVPFLLSRKRQAYEKVKRIPPSRKIVEVIDAGESECVCIKVEAPDELYVTRDYIVTHNSRMQLTWASEIVSQSIRANGASDKVLILAPLAVAAQTVREGKSIGVHVTLCREPVDVTDGINITNYDRVHRFDPSQFGAVVLDESSCIKHENAKTLAQLIAAFGETKYKLCATATPAPNDFAELGTHAEFLGICTRTEMLSEFFVHDASDTGEWRLKGHARAEFWRWVSSWGALIRKPSDLGYDNAGYDLPPLTVQHHHAPTDKDTLRRLGVLFADQARDLVERRNARKASAQKRVEMVAAMVNASKEQWVVWGDLNIETQGVARLVPDAVEVAGPDDPGFKAKAALDFADGKIRVLVSKSSIFGFGMNWQSCARVAFIGVSDSWESYYQAVRRCWRFGQRRPVEVHIFASEAEGAVTDNLKRKEADAQKMADELSAMTRDALRENVTRRVARHNPYCPAASMTIPGWLRSA